MLADVVFDAQPGEALRGGLLLFLRGVLVFKIAEGLRAHAQLVEVVGLLVGVLG